MQQSQSEEIASQQAKLQRLTSQLQQLTADLQQLKQQRESRLAELKQMQVAQGEMQTQAGKTQQSIQDLRDQIAAIESEVADKKRKRPIFRPRSRIAKTSWKSSRMTARQARNDNQFSWNAVAEKWSSILKKSLCRRWIWRRFHLSTAPLPTRCRPWQSIEEGRSPTTRLTCLWWGVRTGSKNSTAVARR